VVIAIGAMVHSPGLSGDRLVEAESSWFGVVTALACPVTGWQRLRAAGLGWSPPWPIW